MKPVAIVIPCRNEARRLDQAALLAAVERFPGLAILVVDDGSTDETAAVAAHLARLSPAIGVLCLPANVGKAEAVRRGVNHLLATGGHELIGFWDADLAAPLAALPEFIAEFERDAAVRLVIGCRWPRLGSRIERRPARNCVSGCLRLLVRWLLRLPVHDTQCGAKLMTRAAAERLFAAPFVSRWLFDVELLLRMGGDLRFAAVELPLRRWRDVDGSKMTWRDALRSLPELLRIAIARPDPKMVK